MAETFVIGAGLTGVTTAYYLAKSGHKVTVFDSNPHPAHEEHCASYANGGQISVSHAEPWANPSAPLKMLSWLGKDDAPLLWRWNLNPNQWKWGMKFLYQCLPFNWKRNIKDIVNLAEFSRYHLGELVREEGISYDRLREGIIHFYDDVSEFEGAKKASEVLARYGCNRSPKDRAGLYQIENALDYDGIIGGTITWDDESGDAAKFTKQLAGILASKYGVNFILNTEVTYIGRTEGDSLFIQTRNTNDREPSQFRFPQSVVICAGAWSPALTKQWGETLDILPAKGYSMTVKILNFDKAPIVSLTDDGHKMVFSRLGDRLRVAGTAEFGATHEHISNTDLDARCLPLRKRTIELFGNETFDWDTIQYWAGMRPATPSNVPYIGESRVMDDVYFNTGHGTLGWTMACGSGKAITDIVNGSSPQIDFSWYE